MMQVHATMPIAFQYRYLIPSSRDAQKVTSPRETSADSAAAARSEIPRAGGGSTPTSALHQLRVRPVPFRIAKAVLIRHHYLESMPGGTQLALGAFIGESLQGVLTLGVGPPMVYRLVDGAKPGDCATLSRLWLSDALPRNSESRMLGVVLRALKRCTSLRFLVSYADPAMGHRGGIYQATGWFYTGLSEATNMIDLGDGVPRHSRTVGHAFGTHSIRHFEAHDIPVRTVQQEPKHRYVHFIDSSWRGRLRVPVLPYPKEDSRYESY